MSASLSRGPQQQARQWTLPVSPSSHHAALPCLPPHLQVTKEEYAAKGATALGSALLQQLRGQGANPYYIPVGGSSALGVWGYLQAIEEVRQQSQELGLSFDVIASVSCLSDMSTQQGGVCVPCFQAIWAATAVGAASSPAHIAACNQCLEPPQQHNPSDRRPTPPSLPTALCAQACGSAGTTAGLALGAKLSGLCPAVEGYMVCDDEKYFHDTINELYQELGYTQSSESVVVLVFGARDSVLS